MEKKTNPMALIRHPFVIVLASLVIAYAGYLFGQWLHGIVN